MVSVMMSLHVPGQKYGLVVVRYPRRERPSLTRWPKLRHDETTSDELEKQKEEEEQKKLDDLLNDIRGEDLLMTSQQLIRNLKLTQKKRQMTTIWTMMRLFETEYERFTQEAECHYEGSGDRQRKMMEKKFGRFQESLKNIPSSADKKSFLQSMAHAKTFEGRINSGAGKNNLGFADVQNLMANRDRLIQGYGDGSPEAIKKFVKSVRSQEVSDDFVDASFEMLPDAIQEIT